MRHYYDNGLPFNTDLATNLKDLQERVDNKKASLIIIDGGVGEGKTTLLIEVLDYINKINGLPPIELEGPQLAMGGVEFLKKMRGCHERKLPCVGYDEAGDFSKRASLTSFNAMINRTFETFRAFKCIVVMSLPNFDVLDQQILDNKIPRMLLHLYDRRKNYGQFSAYGLPEILFLKYWFKKTPIKSFAFSKVWPNFHGTFLDLEPDRSAALDKVSTTNKLEILKKSEVKIEGLLSYAEMATKLQKSLSWVRVAIVNLKLKPVRRIAKQHFFSPETINILAEHADNTEPIGRPKGVKNKTEATT